MISNKKLLDFQNLNTFTGRSLYHQIQLSLYFNSLHRGGTYEAFIKNKELMIEGVNFITDETGNIKAIMLDLIRFKQEGVQDKAVFEALTNLQELINNAGIRKKTANTWDEAKEKLKNLNL